jgi:hypothetical protein
MIYETRFIPSELRDQIEAAANSLGLGLVWAADSIHSTEPATQPAPEPTDPRVLALSEGFDRALTAIAMMILTFPGAP